MDKDWPVGSPNLLDDAKKLALAVKRVADAIKPTLGPKGRPVKISWPDGVSHETKVGSQIAESLKPDGSWTAKGVVMIKDAAGSGDFGDGTGTTAILAQAILGDWRKAIGAGVDPAALQQGIEDAVAAALSDIKRQVEKISLAQQVVDVGTISAGGDPDIGIVIGQAFLDEPHVISVDDAFGASWRIGYEPIIHLRGGDSFYDRLSPKNRQGAVTLDTTPDGIAKIRVAGDTQHDLFDRRWRVKTAVQSAVAALKGGIVPGGGAALLHSSKSLDKLPYRSEAYQTGVDIVRNALCLPCRQVANNAGARGTRVVDRLLHKDNSRYGYDAQAGHYTDMIDAGIIDPASVVIKALDGASSIASAVVMAPTIAQSGFAPAQVKNRYLRYFLPEFDPYSGAVSSSEYAYAARSGGGSGTSTPSAAPGGDVSGKTLGAAPEAGGDLTGKGQPASAPGSGGDAAGVPATAGEAAPTTAAQERFLVGEFPESVVLDKVNTLTVFVMQHDERGAVPFTVSVPKGGLTLQIFIQADGFELTGPNHAPLVIPERGESAGAAFKLKAVEAPLHVIHVSALVAGTSVAGLTLEVRVGKPTDEPAPTAPPATNVLTRLAGEDGDVALILQQNPKTHQYTFTWFDKDGVQEPVFQDTPFDDLNDFVGRQIEEVQEIVRETYEMEAREVHESLRSRGIDWWQQLIPKEIRDRFIANYDRIKRINIISAGDPIPWEALYPAREDRLEFDRGFLVEQVDICRWLYGPPPPEMIALCRADFIFSKDDLLDSAKTEVGDIIALLQKCYELKGEQIAKRALLIDLFKMARVSLLHFACHNAFDSRGARIFVGLAPIKPEDFIGYQRKLAASAPLIFLNACRTDGKDKQYTALGGWAKSFLRTGAGAFIGTHWEVRDSTAQQFAVALYSALVEERKCFREALKSARAKIQKIPGDPTWLAYTFYGSHSARVKKGVVAAPAADQPPDRPPAGLQPH